MNHDPENTSELDQATADRLARLRAMPVDTSRLDRALRGAIPQAVSTRRRWLSPLRTVAAALVVGVSVAALLWALSGGAVEASAAEMAQMHRDLVEGRIPVTQVDSIEQASAALRDQGSAGDLPQAPDTHVKACCMRSIKDKKVACVLLKSEGVPVTMTVARSADVHMHHADSVVRDGNRYYVQPIGSLNMVMTERNGRWVCLIGELPTERLVGMAAGLRF